MYQSNDDHVYGFCSMRTGIWVINCLYSSRGRIKALNHTWTVNLVDWCLQKCSSRSNLLFWWFNVNVVRNASPALSWPSSRPLLPAFTQSVRYSSWCVPSSSSSASSCSLNIAHLFVNVVGNCSKSNPGPLPFISASLGVRRGRVAGLSAATACQPPVQAADTLLLQLWRCAQRTRWLCLLPDGGIPSTPWRVD